ncbi:MAG: hypothetical protein WC397_04450 [Candidatus Paceibacterota bacterium]|jgi:hypothetical protein
MARRKKNQFKILLTLSFAALGALMFCYIFQVSQIAQASYEIGESQRKLETIKKDVASLESALLRNNTLGNYEQKLNELGYQKIDRIDYVAVSGAVVAQSR